MQRQTTNATTATRLHRMFSLYALMILSVMAVLPLTSCGNKTAEELESEINTGVVLIQNKSYYEIKLDNGNSLYFSSYDKEDGIQDLTANKDSIVMSVAYGTGFLVSNDGKIATNHHVVSNIVEDDDITGHLASTINAIKSALSDEFDETMKKYEIAQRLTSMALFDSDVSVEEYKQYRDVRDELSQDLDICRTLYASLSEIKPENAKIEYHNEVAVAYNDTFVTSDNDFSTCVIRKTDKDHDLAIIQLKDKKTPADKHVFSITSDDPLEAYNFTEKISKTFKNDKNSEIFMPGFNLGPSLALTDEGIKLQFSSGTVSRRTSDEILYTIPSLPGSSGSPILNRKGEVVAVNSAGVRGADNFNQGIRVKHLHKILND